MAQVSGMSLSAVGTVMAWRPAAGDVVRRPTAERMRRPSSENHSFWRCSGSHWQWRRKAAAKPRGIERRSEIVASSFTFRDDMAAAA
nr:unnamed protein product [Digitaria exilis]